MAVCLMNLDEKEKSCFGFTLAILCIVEILIGLLICGLILYFHLHLQWKILLIEGYDSQNLFLSILAIGFLLVGLHLIGGKMCYDCGQLETRKRFDKILFVWVLLILLLTIVEVSLSISCFAHTLKVYWGFKTGLLNTMKNYMSNTESKYKLDKLQLENGCCGSEGFHDWMTLDWTPQEFNPLVSNNGGGGGGEENENNNNPNPNMMNSNLKEQYFAFYKDIPSEISLEPHQLVVVPFSCCDISSEGPCFHDYITQPNLAFGSTLEGMTARDQWWTTSHGLHSIGCAHNIMDQYNEYLNIMGYAFLGAAGFEFIILILSRYLETSISNMELLGDEEKGISPGWICEDCNAV